MSQRKIIKCIPSVTENLIRGNCIYIFYKSSDEISREPLLQELNASFTKRFTLILYLSKNSGDILLFQDNSIEIPLQSDLRNFYRRDKEGN